MSSLAAFLFLFQLLISTVLSSEGLSIEPPCTSSQCSRAQHSPDATQEEDEDEDDSMALLQVANGKESLAMAATSLKSALKVKDGTPVASPVHPPTDTANVVHVTDAAISTGSDTTVHVCTKHEALWICIVAISSIALGVGIYRLATKLAIGAENKMLKLALLTGAFAVCTWGTRSTNVYLAHAVRHPLVAAATQLFFIALFTALFIFVARSRLTPIREQVLTWAFMSMPFSAEIVLGFFLASSFSFAQIMFLRGFLPILALPFELLTIPEESKPYVTTQMIAAVVLIMASACIYHQQETTFMSPSQMLLACGAIAVAIIFDLFQRRWLTTECKDLSIETCMVLQNGIGLLPTMLFTYGVTPGFDMPMLKEVLLGDAAIVLVLSGLIGAAGTYFVLALLREISVTSFFVAHNGVDIVLAVVEKIIFLNPIEWPWHGCGLIVRLIGVVCFAKSQSDGLQQLRAVDSARKMEVGKEQRIDTARRAKEAALLKVREKAQISARGHHDPQPRGHHDSQASKMPSQCEARAAG